MTDSHPIRDVSSGARSRFDAWRAWLARSPLSAPAPSRNGSETVELANEPAGQPSNADAAMAALVPTDASAPDAAYLANKADRETAKALENGLKPPRDMVELVERAQAALGLAEPETMPVLEHAVRRAQLRLHLMRRHVGKIFHQAQLDQWESAWDPGSLEVLLKAHAVLKTPQTELQPIFKRLRHLRGPEYAASVRSAYFGAIGDWSRQLRRAFGAKALNPSSTVNIRALIAQIPKDDLNDAARQEQIAYAARIVECRGRRHPGASDAVALALSVANTLEERLEALRLYGAAEPHSLGDRNLHANFHRFLVSLVYFIHTGGACAETIKALEEEHWWNKYNAPYRGMTALQDTAYWRQTLKVEAARRDLFQAAKTGAANRIAFVSDSPKFSFTLIDLMKAKGFQADVVQFDFIEEFYRKNRSIDLLSRPLEAFGARGLRRELLAHPLVRKVSEADCLFVDFANRAAVWASWFKRPHQRLIIRLHAYEALSAWPYLINWAAVDGLVFVSPAIEAIFRRELGERVEPIPSVVIPNFKVLSPMAWPRPDLEPGRVLGLLGAVIYRKQPVQAVRILKALQERDSPLWQLRLAGDYWPSETASPETEHKQEFEQLVSKLPTPNSVIIDGFQTDIARWYDKIDFLLSCSLREGTHEAVNEAMHFNTLPVVRDWPLVAPFGGARCVYPVLEEQGLLYDDVDQAVDSILKARRSYAAKARVLKNFAKDYLDNDKNVNTLVDFMMKC